MNRLALMVLKNIWRVPGAYWKLCHYAKYRDKYPEEEAYRHIQYILRCAVQAGNVALQVYGKENIPKQNGFMLYGNHQGLFDVLAIATTCDNPLGAVFKKELSNVPLLKQIIACTRSFALDRENIRQSLEVIQGVTAEVLKGRNYLIFPEGRRGRTGNEVMAFHGGSFKCALKAKCPILPIALVDSYKVLDQKGSKPVSVQIHYLEPIPYEAYQGMKAVEVAAMVRARIEAVVQEYAVS